MLLAAAAMALVAQTHSTPNALSRCLSMLAKAPEYASQTHDQLALNDKFLSEAQDNYCSDETSELWATAHDRARQKLGLQAGSPLSLDQQRVATEEMRKIMLDAWANAASSTSSPKLDKSRMAKFYLSWLSEEENSRPFLAMAEMPIRCGLKAISTNRSLSPRDMEAGLDGPVLKRVVAGCGLEGVMTTITKAIQTRFPDADAGLARSVASQYLITLIVAAAI